MADKSINELVAASAISASDLFVLEQNATAKKLTGQVLINFLTAAADGHGGISVIAKTGTAGLVDTYTITYADTSISTFTITNGAKGDTGQAYYVWIRYSAVQPTQDNDVSTTPDDWMGIYTGTSATAPTAYAAYTWYELKGATGDTGAAAAISSQAVTYQASVSGTTAPTGTWQSDIPAVTQGNYLWTRTVLTFNDGTSITSYSVGRMGVDGQGAPGSELPLMDSTANAGESTNYSRADHVHPSDSGKAAADHSHGQSDITGLAAALSEKQTALTAGDVTKAMLSANATNTSVTVTLPVASWSSKAQTVSVAGMTSAKVVIVSPAPASFTAYGEAGVRATAQGSGTLTFTCEDIPSTELIVNVTMLT